MLSHIHKTAPLAAVVLVFQTVSARTVALWPIEADSKGRTDGRCVISVDNDLSAANCQTFVSDIGWCLPPNQDRAQHAFEPFNGHAVSNSAASARGFLYNQKSGALLRRDCNWTVEGWVRFWEIPDENGVSCIVAAWDGTSGSPFRWNLTLQRRAAEGYACSWVLRARYGNDDVEHVFGSYPSQDASLALEGRWMHVALSHSAIDGGSDTWRLYIDGVQFGATVSAQGVVASNLGTPTFDIGSRRNVDELSRAAFDYWRISDVVLEAGALLCAGGDGTLLNFGSTVAYWPLGIGADGFVDGYDAVGSSPLSSGFCYAEQYATRMSPSSDSAFSGNPPNPEVSLSGGNAGSVRGYHSGSMLQHTALGASFNLSSDFTVEGWFSPRLCGRTDKGASVEVASSLFGTRPDASFGWMLQYRAKSASEIVISLYCKDGVGVLVDNAILSGGADLSGWFEEWRHVALVYDKDGGDGGYGRWSLYMEGKLLGHFDNERAASEITQSRPFVLGGRMAYDGQCFEGGIDCVRACGAALSAAQLLCDPEGYAATAVLALWPLNVSAGTYLDLRDVSGNGRNFVALDANHESQTVVADLGVAPRITNPDRSIGFRGDPSSVNGSARFRNPDAVVDNHLAYLMAGGSEVMDALAEGRDFTFECYWRRASAEKDVSADQEVFMAIADKTSVRARIFRKDAGIYVWEDLNANIGDTLVPRTGSSDFEFDRWYHLAFVHTIEDDGGAKKSVWRIYVDGALKGSVSGTRTSTTSHVCKELMIGGRFWSNKNSVVGNLSSVRVSAGALEETDFLCAEKDAVGVASAAATVSYWPINVGDGGLDNSVGMYCPLVAKGTALPQEDKARPRVPNESVYTEYPALSMSNKGSYALGANGCLEAENVGFAMGLRSAFTVEGWLKLPAVGGERDIAAAGDVSSGEGVRLFLSDADGKTDLNIIAREAWPSSPIVRGRFNIDMSAYTGSWTYIAITYDPHDGNGSWTLFVDGERMGDKIENYYRPSAASFFRSGDFHLGSLLRPLECAFDMWRISAGICPKEDLLWKKRQALVIILR